MTRHDPVLTDHERMDLALRAHHRLNQERRKALGTRMMIELYRQGRITLDRLRRSGIPQGDIDAAIHDRDSV